MIFTVFFSTFLSVESTELSTPKKSYFTHLKAFAVGGAIGVVIGETATHVKSSYFPKVNFSKNLTTLLSPILRNVITPVTTAIANDLNEHRWNSYTANAGYTILGAACVWHGVKSLFSYNPNPIDLEARELIKSSPRGLNDLTYSNLLKITDISTLPKLTPFQSYCDRYKPNYKYRIDFLRSVAVRLKFNNAEFTEEVQTLETKLNSQDAKLQKEAKKDIIQLYQDNIQLYQDNKETNNFNNFNNLLKTLCIIAKNNITTTDDEMINMFKEEINKFFHFFIHNHNSHPTTSWRNNSKLERFFSINTHLKTSYFTLYYDFPSLITRNNLQRFFLDDSMTLEMLRHEYLSAQSRNQRKEERRAEEERRRAEEEFHRREREHRNAEEERLRLIKKLYLRQQRCPEEQRVEEQRVEEQRVEEQVEE